MNPPEGAAQTAWRRSDERGNLSLPETGWPMTTEQALPLHDAPDGAELQAAKKAVQSLVSAFKTYALYPPEHSASRKNVAKLQEDLEAFLQEYPSLHLDTARNSFLYKGEVLFEGAAEENNPAYLLTRDGLLFLEFVRGLTVDETAELLNLLNRNRNPFEEPEGDIVTCLWQENFAHILYEEMDLFTLESFQFDLSTFRMTPDNAAAAGTPAAPEQHTAPQAAEGKETEETPPASPFLADSGAMLLTLTPEETATLAAEVQAAERKDNTSDIIDILLIILVVQKNKANFLHALEFLEYQFFETMDRRDFHLSYKLLNNIRLIRGQCREKKTWALPLLDSFIRTLSGAEYLARIVWVQNPASLNRYTPYLEELLQVLRLLTPESMTTLARLAARIPMENLKVRNEILAIIEGKAVQAPEQLRDLIAAADEQVALLLIPVIPHLVRADAARIYLQMTRHDSPEVRKIGLDNYMQTAAAAEFRELLHLLGDADARIRERILSYLLQAGPEIAEPLLIRYLEQVKTGDPQGQAQVFDHYRALAACRPFAVLPFLEKTLLDSRLTEMFSNRNTVHIKASALALRTINTEEALAILKKGRQSMRPDIRLACQHVLKR